MKPKKNVRMFYQKKILKKIQWKKWNKVQVIQKENG